MLKLILVAAFVVAAGGHSLRQGQKYDPAQGAVDSEDWYESIHEHVANSDDRWMHPTPKKFQRSLGSVKATEDYQHWIDDAQSTLRSKVESASIRKNRIKHIVFFLGDGMSVPTITAARIYKGQVEGSEYGGEEASLFMDSLPGVGLSKTFCSDAQVADSACSATAYLGGTKANIGTIGVKPTVTLNDCEGQANPENHVLSIMHWAQEAGMSTGIVTTTRITHASPTGAYGHIANRDWENDAMVTSDGGDPSVCPDIARQLIESQVGEKFNVILGGGRREFHGADWTDTDGRKGRRLDGRNLEQEWEDKKSASGVNYKRISTAQELQGVSTNDDFVFGLFNYDHINFALYNTTDPSLELMTEKAIQVLHKNPLGSVLFVEGGRIDHAHHETQARLSLQETLEFDKAIAKASNLTAAYENETLILVTADHAHVFSIAGYPVRGNPLFGISDIADDNLPYPTLSYANGPGYRRPDASGNRYDITNDDFGDVNYRQTTGAPIYSETHGGDDVAILSKGPFSHLLTGVVMQSYIPHALKYAACIGLDATCCSDGEC